MINTLGHFTNCGTFCSVVNLGLVSVSLENGTNVFQTYMFDIRSFCAVMEIVVCYTLCIRAMVRSKTQDYSAGICYFAVKHTLLGRKSKDLVGSEFTEL